jgi:hypothetical protein
MALHDLLSENLYFQKAVEKIPGQETVYYFSDDSHTVRIHVVDTVKETHIHCYFDVHRRMFVHSLTWSYEYNFTDWFLSAKERPFFPSWFSPILKHITAYFDQRDRLRRLLV